MQKNGTQWKQLLHSEQIKLKLCPKRQDRQTDRHTYVFSVHLPSTSTTVLRSHLLASASCMSSRINRKCNKQSRKKIWLGKAKNSLLFWHLASFAQLFWASVATELAEKGSPQTSDNILPYADIYFRKSVCSYACSVCVCFCVSWGKFWFIFFCSFSHVSQFVPSAVLNYTFMFALCEVKSQWNCGKLT